MSSDHPDHSAGKPAVAVLGAGSWGTALAALIARHGHPTVLWGRDAATIAAIDAHHENPRYLPGIPLPDTLRATPDLAAALAGCDLVLVVVPSKAPAGKGAPASNASLSMSIASISETWLNDAINSSNTFTFNVSTAGNFLLKFTGDAMQGGNNFVAVDNVSVSAKTAAVPGPEAGAGLGALLLAGFGAYVLRRGRRQISA